jgi:flagellar hook-basal body complex protein FliE
MTIAPLPSISAPADADSSFGAARASAGVGSQSGAAATSFASALENAFDAAGGALARADRSERAFARGAGGLQEMVLDRAQADIALQIATTAASKTSQALSTILGMQV